MMTPDFSKYTVLHVGISGGKDSTATLLWAVNESGFDPEKIIATFCDTGNEHPITYEYIAMLRRKVHYIHTIKPEMDFYELAKHKGRFPSPKARFCTIQLKVIPSREFVLDLLQQGHNPLLITGVRADESPDRAKLPPFDWDDSYGCDVYRPLLDWSKGDVFAYLAKYKIPPNPLYGFGAKRVGCLPCIMSNKQDMRMISTKFPERIDMLRQAEGDINSTFFGRNHIPERFRSKEFQKSNGEVVLVPTIDDVVLWSKTKWGGRELLDEYKDDPELCDSILRMCE